MIDIKEVTFNFQRKSIDFKEEIIKLLRSTKRKDIEYLINFLLETDFFIAPASAKYHSAHVGGLAEHSYKVFELFYRKCKLYKLNIPIETIIITTLLHDICKIDTYIIEKKWRKDSKNKWESYEAYGYTNHMPIGHGEKSVIIISKFIELTEQEILMIRWHMGFSVNKEDYSLLNNALEIEKYIVLLSTSDFEASFLFEERGTNEI